MKRNKRFRGLYWLVLVVPLVILWAVGSKAGIVRNATSSQNGQDSISIPFALLDTLGNPVAVDSAQDWGCMITYYPNGAEAVVDSFLLDASTNAQVRYNTARFRGLQTWYYRRQISDLDGTPVNGTYSYQFILRDSSLHMFTIYRGEFQVYQSKTFADAIDSVTIDGSHLAGLTASISATTIGADAIGSSELATDAIGAAEIAADAIGASELAANSITSSEIADNAIDAGAIATDAITAAKIAADAIGASEIAADAIGAAEIADAAIDSATFSSSAKTGLAFYVWNSATRTLTSAGSGGITEAEMWDMLDTAFVNAFRIALGDTLATFSDSATVDRSSLVIVAGNFGAGAIDASAIAANAIGASEIADGAIDAGAFANDAITVNVIDDDAITSDKIAANAIGSSELATTAGDEIADEVWDEVINTGHSISGSSGEFLNTVYSSGVNVASINSNAITAASIATGALGRAEFDSTYYNAIQDSVWKADSAAYYNNAGTMGKVAAATGGAGASAADVWAYGTRTLTSAGASDIYPLSGFTFVVDAAGADPDQQFVVDTASLGGLSSHEETLINRMLIIRSLSGIEVQIPTTITRVAYTAANCSVSVNFAMPLNFAANDTIQITGLWQHNFATLAEASDSAAQAVLDADTSSHITDGTVGQAIARGGADLTDSTRIKAMLANNEYSKMKDSANVVFAKGNASSVPRLGDLSSTDDSVNVKGGRVNIVDSTGVLGEEIAGGSGGGGCPDSVGYAVTLVAYDSLAVEPVQSAQMALRTTINGADLAVSSLTGASGAYTFTIATPGTYYVITRAAGMTFPIRTLVVSGAQTDTVNGAGYTVSGHAIVVGSVDCEYCDVRFVLESSGQPVTDTSTGLLVTQTVIDTTANSFGDFTMGLPKTGNMVYLSGSVRKHPQWRVKVSPTDVEKEVKWEKTFEIPSDSTTINLRYVR